MEFKIYLVGDAGDHTESGETLVHLKEELNNNPNSAVIFLGDNSYKDILGGIIPFGFKGFDSSRNTMDKIRSQLALVDNYRGFVFFLPGNHDWWNRPTYESGKKKLAMEESFIEKNLKENLQIANPGNVFYPKNGQYGPDYIELDQGRIRLIFLDTYRIIQTGIRKNKAPVEEKTFYQKLDSLIQAGYLKSQRILIVAHHPVRAAGPINRSVKNPYLFARIKASMTDFPSYREMSVQMNAILKKYPGIVYASGHVHALQYFQSPDSVRFIISGSGSKEKRLTAKEIVQYNTSAKSGEYLLWNSGGFFELDFSEQEIKTVLHYEDGQLRCALP